MPEPTLTSYFEGVFGSENPTMRALRERSLARGIPSIQVPQEVGRLLQVLIVQSGARRVLEIGTLFGYSSILMGNVLPEGGHITTLEVSELHASVARQNFEEAGLASRILLLQGNAVETLDRLQGQQFDFVFIDADKSGYPAYLERAMALTSVGATIVADNLWRGGAVADPESSDPNARGAARFNEMLAADPRLLTAIVPTREGADALSVSVRVSD